MYSRQLIQLSLDLPSLTKRSHIWLYLSVRRERQHAGSMSFLYKDLCCRSKFRLYWILGKVLSGNSQCKMMCGNWMNMVLCCTILLSVRHRCSYYKCFRCMEDTSRGVMLEPNLCLAQKVYWMVPLRNL